MAAGRAGIAGGYALGLMIAILRAAGAAAATTFLELDIYGWPRLEDQRQPGTSSSAPKILVGIADRPR
jgi:hypothetical protein